MQNISVDVHKCYQTDHKNQLVDINGLRIQVFKYETVFKIL